MTWQRKKNNDPFNGLVQERHNFITNALELRLSCTNPTHLSCEVHYTVADDIVLMRGVTWGNKASAAMQQTQFNQNILVSVPEKLRQIAKTPKFFHYDRPSLFMSAV